MPISKSRKKTYERMAEDAPFSLGGVRGAVLGSATEPKQKKDEDKYSLYQFAKEFMGFKPKEKKGDQ